MFADALLDYQRMDRSRRGWATLTSFGVQALAVACLLVLPLFYTQVLPHLDYVSRVIAPPAGPAPVVHPEPSPQQRGVASSSNVVGEFLRTPGRIPSHISQVVDAEVPGLPLVTGVGDHYVDGVDPRNIVIGGTGNRPMPVIARQAPPPPVRVSVMMEGSLVHRVEPTYPAICKSTGIQGSVLLAAVIGRDGKVQNLQVLSGHPLLVQAALDAVRRWRYKPYVLNDTPVEVETRITVNFILSR